MGNNEFINMFMGAHAIFKPYRISDHAPAMLDGTITLQFLWMFRLVKKLKNLKNPLRKLLHEHGNVFANENVSTAFVTHYESFLGQEGITSPLNTNNLFDKVLSSNMADDMILNEAWEIVGHDVINAVKEFFTNGKLLKELKSNVILLLYQVQIPMKEGLVQMGKTPSLSPYLFYYRHGSSYVDVEKTDVLSAQCIMDALDEFKEVIPFEEGRLPVKYLGVPLVPSRLIYRDCKELIDKVRSRTNDWKNKSLSIAGRLQLVQSVISSMNVYWSSVFILPTRILLEIEQIMRCFLWSQGNSGKSNSKVAWEVVCLPKDEGGLGIRRLDSFNKALMAAHIWKLLNKKNSLWVTWIHIHKINDRNFWDIPCRGNMSWAWRKVLQLRHIIRKFIWHKIGDGQRTSIWYDHWCHLSPLAEVVSYRDIHRAGLLPSSKVADVMVSGSLVWPIDLSSKYSNLLSIAAPSISAGTMDTIEWKSSDGVIQPFSARVVWNSIRPHDNKPSLELIVDLLSPFSKSRTTRCVVSKLVLAATAYFLWRERNDRLFKKGKNTVDHVIGSIKSSVRLQAFVLPVQEVKGGVGYLEAMNISEAPSFVRLFY
ncbi:hypothetical protein Tco_0290522 [Tanacetum coccineum]